jgi:glucosamine 6-phosphate synthetase-like amidotransferase/phosphosugar isomerase protein
MRIDTIAVTGNSTSSITQEAAAFGACYPFYGPAPGIRSLYSQLLTLFLCALRLGEMRHVLSPEEATRWRQRLRDVATIMEETIAANDVPIRRLVEHWRDEHDWVFVGAGPSYATALFSAAKLVESCGVHAWAQELEEWGHIQFFNRRARTPTCVIVPPGRSVDRALELLPYVKGIGRYTLPSHPAHNHFSPPKSIWCYQCHSQWTKCFPLVYCLAGELLAYYMAAIRDTPFFCTDRQGFSSGRDRLRDSHTLRRVDDLRALSENHA